MKVMEAREIVGQYFIKGKNQSAEIDFTYEGILTLTLDEHERFVAHWLIGDQEQHATGFFKDDILLLNFSYVGDDDLIYKGVAVYRCLDAHTLNGFWSEKYGDPNYLGEELCTRLLGDGYLN